MALNYVTLTCDLYDGQGNALNGGTATFSPTVQLTDTTDHELIIQAPVTAAFKASGSPAVKLLATDNGAVLPAGWAWTVTYSGVAGSPAAFSFFLPFSGGAAQNLSAISPVSTAVTQYPLNPMTAGGDLIYGLASPAGTPARLGIGTNGQGLVVSSGLPAWGNVMTRVAATPASGYNLVNGTGTIVSWTAPNDGKMHMISVFGCWHVTSTETGGHTKTSGTFPDASAFAPTLKNNGLTTGTVNAAQNQFMIQAASTVTVSQDTALTAGATVMWVEIWADMGGA